jgi:hypothetical protein
MHHRRRRYGLRSIFIRSIGKVPSLRSRPTPGDLSAESSPGTLQGTLVFSVHTSTKAAKKFSFPSPTTSYFGLSSRRPAGSGETGCRIIQGTATSAPLIRRDPTPSSYVSPLRRRGPEERLPAAASGTSIRRSAWRNFRIIDNRTIKTPSCFFNRNFKINRTVCMEEALSPIPVSEVRHCSTMPRIFPVSVRLKSEKLKWKTRTKEYMRPMSRYSRYFSAFSWNTFG